MRIKLLILLTSATLSGMLPEESVIASVDSAKNTEVGALTPRPVKRNAATKNYLIKRASGQVKLDANWDGTDWGGVQPLNIAIFRRGGSDHRPETQCKLQYDTGGIYGLFRVRDKYVKSTRTQYNGQVCRDSCVEFFVAPAGGKGYMNFEFNCGGCMLLYHVTEFGQIKNFHAVPQSATKNMRIFHSLPKVVYPGIQEETVWYLGFFIPFSLFRDVTGMRTGEISGQVWRANLYKCGDDTSHPHWASWRPLIAKNFHLPECFGAMTFE